MDSFEEFTYVRQENGKRVTEKYLVPNKKVLLECDCGCGIIAFSMWGEGDESYILYYSMDFGSKQPNLWGKIKEKAGLLWAILCGKEYRFFEVTTTNKKLLELSEEISSYLGEHSIGD